MACWVMQSHISTAIATKRLLWATVFMVLLGLATGCSSPAPKPPARPTPPPAPRAAIPVSKPVAAAPRVMAPRPGAATDALPTPELSAAAQRPHHFPMVVFPSARPQPPPPTGKVGTQAAGFRLRTPVGGEVVFPDDAQGQPSVLMFWPSWCPYSRELQPYLQAIWQDYQPLGVRLWMLNIDETGDPVATLKARQLSLPLLLKADRVADQFGVRLTATVKIVDGRNQVAYSSDESTTSPAERALQIRRVLNALLGSRALPLPVLQTQPPPSPVPESVWVPWVERYLATLKPGEWLPAQALQGEISTGKQAIALARALWSTQYGSAETRAQAPYRSFRINHYWVVLGSGSSDSTALGDGYVAVFEVGNGRVIRLARQAQ